MLDLLDKMKDSGRVSHYEQQIIRACAKKAPKFSQTQERRFV